MHGGLMALDTGACPGCGQDVARLLSYDGNRMAEHYRCGTCGDRAYASARLAFAS